MRIFLKVLFVFLIIIITGIINISSVCAQDTVLKGSVSMVPSEFYGMWRVLSKLADTDSPDIFNEKNLDLWNLTKTNGVIKLSNPFNGESAEIKVDKVEGKDIVFSKTEEYKNKKIKDTVEIHIEDEVFEGNNTIVIETFVDGKIVKIQTAKYTLNGEKIAGEVK